MFKLFLKTFSYNELLQRINELFKEYFVKTIFIEYF